MVVVAFPRDEARPILGFRGISAVGAHVSNYYANAKKVMQTQKKEETAANKFVE
jgi:hypothetical protein